MKQKSKFFKLLKHSNRFLALVCWIIIAPTIIMYDDIIVIVKYS